MHFIQKIFNFIAHPNHFRTIVILAVLVIAVPLTVIVVQQQQEIRQRAAENQYSCTINFYRSLDQCAGPITDTKSFNSSTDESHVCDDTLTAVTCTLISQSGNASLVPTSTSVPPTAPPSVPLATPIPTPSESLSSFLCSGIATAPGDQSKKSFQCQAGPQCAEGWFSYPGKISGCGTGICCFQEIPTCRTLSSGFAPINTPCVKNGENGVCNGGGNCVVQVAPTQIPTTIPTSISTQATIGIPTTGPTQAPYCYFKNKGDADCDGKINILDYEVWKTEFVSELNGTVTSKRSDFNEDGKIDIVDANIWKKNL